MSKRDELLFGEEPRAARDSDGDGVSDAQERRDGTNPYDAADSIHHGGVAVDPTHDASDPRGDVRQATLEHDTTVDVKSNLPAGFSAEQSLGTGLDGKAMHGGPNHYGIGDDAHLGGHSDPNSVAGITRDVSESTSRAGGSGGAGGGPGAGNTIGVAGGVAGGPAPTDTGKIEVPGQSWEQKGPPTGAELSNLTNPAHNPDLVSAGRVLKEAPPMHVEGSKPAEAPSILDDISHAATAVKEAVEKAAKEVSDTVKAITGTTVEKGLDNLGSAGGGKTLSDPDSTTGGGIVTPTAEQFAHAVGGLGGGVTDTVKGYDGGPQVEDKAPPAPKGDLVRDPIEKAGTAKVDTPVYVPSSAEISHTINPADDFGAPQIAGGSTAGGEGDGRGHSSSAATAADSSSSDSAKSDATDGGSTSAIHSVGDNGADTGVIATPVVADPARETNDPRGDIARPTLDHDTTVDVNAHTPAGFDASPSLGTGLDGKPTSTEPNHYGVGDNTPLSGRGDPNSVAGITRDVSESTSRAGGAGGAGGGSGAGNTIGVAGGVAGGPAPTDTGKIEVPGQSWEQKGPPSGAELSDLTNPAHNPDLVSAGRVLKEAPPMHVEGSKPAEAPSVLDDISHAAGAVVEKVEKAVKEVSDTVKAITGTTVEKGLDNLGSAGGGKTLSDPDSTTGGGIVTPTAEQFAHAVGGLGGGVTDTVQGYEAPQVEDKAPPAPKGDLVRDPIEEAGTAKVDTPVYVPSSAEISHTINPGDGFGPPPIAGGTAGGGEGDGRGQSSSAATADDAATADAATGAHVTVVGGAAGSGIQSVGGDAGGDEAGGAGAQGMAGGNPVGMAGGNPVGMAAGSPVGQDTDAKGGGDVVDGRAHAEESEAPVGGVVVDGKQGAVADDVKGGGDVVDGGAHAEESEAPGGVAADGKQGAVADDVKGGGDVVDGGAHAEESEAPGGVAADGEQGAVADDSKGGGNEVESAKSEGESQDFHSSIGNISVHDDVTGMSGPVVLHEVVAVAIPVDLPVMSVAAADDGAQPADDGQPADDTSTRGAVADDGAPPADDAQPVDDAQPMDDGGQIAFDAQPVDDAPAPIDPVADAMDNPDPGPPQDAPTESFGGLDVPDDLAVPDVPDLDDGF